MAEIPFTQFVAPHGRRVEVRIDRPEDVSTKAEKIIALGYRFECEVLTTCEVSLTIAGDKGDEDIEVVSNGPEVPLAVDRLINRFSEHLSKAA